MKFSPIAALTEFTLRFKPVVFILLILLVGGGILVAPFDWNIPRDENLAVAVDAIPDIGENQQIVFTEWPGSSPQDVEDQITYPLTATLLGIPKVKTIRSYSYFGFSTIYVIFEESAGWDWSRTKVLEKLSSLPRGLLPENVSPALGPDATALGQVFWYTLEGRDPDGNTTSGWTLQELRTVQDYYVRYALQSADDVAEVASVGGFQKEYQIDVDPDAMRSYGVTLAQVFQAVQQSNIDVGARTIEINKVEYVIRGRGFLQNLDDLRQTVVAARDNTPVTLAQIATVEFGPAMRRGALDNAGAEAVGGVVVARYGANPMKVIQGVKKKIASIESALPKKTLEDGVESQMTIVPFYDRTGLIDETLETLNTALIDEILVTIIVVLLLVFHLRSSALISIMLPLAVLFTFIAMRLFGVTANVVALSGIAIAIGTIVDIGIVICENILKRAESPEGRAEGMFNTVLHSVTEVGGAVLTAILTTVVGFLPVFFLTGSEGKLYQPLAYTKTFALIGAVVIALIFIPPLAQQMLKPAKRELARWPAMALALIAAMILAWHWKPLGGSTAASLGALPFVVILIGGLLLATHGFMRVYERILRFFLRTKWLLVSIMTLVFAAGFGSFMVMKEEFRPALDEGSYLFMPSTMPHASIGESLDALQLQDRAIRSIPEVDQVVGKIGRADSPLDPAPVSMVETVITIRPEWGVDESGKRVRLWRDHIKKPDDIWNEIVDVAQVPGSTFATKLQPIETRLLMLQTGMRAPLGIKVYGPTLEAIEKGALQVEAALKQAPAVDARTVLADRVVGKPYLEIEIDREAIARYGMSVQGVQHVISVAVGGRTLTTTVEGRERYNVRVRYQRERRDSIEELGKILVPSPAGAQIPLGQLAEIKYVRGPQVVKSEDTFLVAYVIFDRHAGYGPVDAVRQTEKFLASMDLELPDGVHYEFTGAYTTYVETQRMLVAVGIVALLLILMIIYFQLRSIVSTLVVWSGVFVAFSGGLMLIWLYNQPWFLAVDIFGLDIRDTFQVGPIAWSTAVGVGFLALFGIATDDGVLMGTYIRQQLLDRKPSDREGIHEAVLFAAVKRNRPAMMTTATTLLALLPVLTSSGRGSDVMLPMAIPTFGGMTIAILTVFVVPTLLCWVEELKLKLRSP